MPFPKWFFLEKLWFFKCKVELNRSCLNVVCWIDRVHLLLLIFHLYTLLSVFCCMYSQINSLLICVLLLISLSDSVLKSIDQVLLIREVLSCLESFFNTSNDLLIFLLLPFCLARPNSWYTRRYLALKAIMESKRWCVELFALENDARGYCSKSVLCYFKKLSVDCIPSGIQSLQNETLYHLCCELSVSTWLWKRIWLNLLTHLTFNGP